MLLIQLLTAVAILMIVCAIVRTFLYIALILIVSMILASVWPHTGDAPYRPIYEHSN
jgi:hypothetical protein